MIKDVVFILGAGACCPYGFPTGKKLRQEIIARHVNDCETYLKISNSFGFGKPIDTQPLLEAKEFVEKFRKSSTESIDLFLARNPEFSKMGKRAIVFRILDAERKSSFRENSKYENQDWYSWLFKQLTDKLKQKEDYSRFCENENVSFITFNYDRSLEHFLYDSLINSFNGIPENKIIEQLNQIKICHVFGHVGPLEWQGQGNQIKYRIDINETSIDALSKNIKIVYEKQESTTLKEAQELISKASRVFFLGFGYAEENLDALGFPDTFTNVQQIFGTAMGFTEREIARIESLFRLEAKKSSSVVTIENFDCLEFLRKYL